jgi:predicted membrane channel-forming protein YqfA (hemolysin III family)
MISQPLSLKPTLPKSNDDTSSSQWMRAAMFLAAAVIILYIQSITRDQDKISPEDLGLVYTLYTTSLLLLLGMSVLW